MKVPVRWVGLLLLLPTAALAHGGEQHDEPTPAKSAPAPGAGIYLAKESQFLLGILTEVVTEREMQARIVALGQVIPRSDRHAELFSPQPGRVSPPRGGRLPYISEHVQKGQVLAIIDASLSATDRASLESQRFAAEAQVAQAEATLRQAGRDLERLESLIGVVAAREVQAAELTLEVAQREHERAKRERNLLTPSRGGGVSSFAIVAPLDGVIADTDLTVGEQVDTTRRLFTVLEASVLWVEAKVYERDIGRIEATAQAQISVEAYPGAYFTGRLFAMSPQIDPTTRTAKAIFELQNSDGRLRPGMFADIQIGAGTAEHALAVPDAAIVTIDGRRVAFVMTGPEEFVARELALGTRDGPYWRVRRGLTAGERVVVQGVHQIRSTAGM